ncbi:hypothetical protein D3C86_1156450 [compost metagenome]
MYWLARDTQVFDMIGHILKFAQPNVPAILYHTHENALMGSLVRVFCEVGTDPTSLDRALEQEPIFQCFFPVKAALGKKLLSIVETRPPKGRWASFPLFKAEGVRLPGSSRGPWWLWDGDREWFYEGEEEAILKYPERAIFNDTMLISLIMKHC